MASGQVDAAAVLDVLRGFNDPESGRNVVQMEQVKNVAASDDKISLTLELTSHSAPIWNDVYDNAEQLLRGRFPQVPDISIDRAVHERPPQKLGEIGLTAKSVIAVGSGKGGVGKSTVSASLAYGLKRAGCKVGLMDADVFGPSIPRLTGTSATPQDVSDVENHRLAPIESAGIPIMSMGYLVDPNQAVIWRGPMLHSAITQFLRDTNWGELDYLIIDMPPGTGDVPLTLSQALPLTGAVVVCTPQEVALLDAVKAIAMFRQVNIPLLGMVENMSGFVCPGCQKRYDIFGSGGARDKGEELEVPFLGEIPIYIQIRENGDAGTTQANFDDPQVAPYLEKIGYQLVSILAKRTKEQPPGASLPVLG